MSYLMQTDARSRISGRFIARVHKEIQKAFVAAAQRGMTQQALASALGVNRSTINKRLQGIENLTLRSIGELAWALDAELKFSMVPRLAQGNHQPELPVVAVPGGIPTGSANTFVYGTFTTATQALEVAA